MPKFTLTLDSTQLANYYACPAMWYLGDKRLLLRNDIREKETVKADSAREQGTYFHKLAERYYRSFPFTMNQSEAIDYALAVDMDHSHCACGHGAEEHVEGCTRQECMCDSFKAKPFPLDAKSRAAVEQRFREYVYTWSAKGDFDIPAPEYVEVGFSECLYEDDEYLFILEGRMDIARCTYQGMQCIVDHKLQTRRKDLYLKRIQFRNYALVGKSLFMVINYVRMAKEASSDTFKRAIASFTAPEQTAWRSELITTYTNIARCLQQIEANPNPLVLPEQNWGNCETGNGYAQCQFSPICEETYLGRRLMENRIEQLYSIRQEWRPW